MTLDYLNTFNLTNIGQLIQIEAGARHCTHIQVYSSTVNQDQYTFIAIQHYFLFTAPILGTPPG